MDGLEFDRLRVGLRRGLQRLKEQLLFAVDGDLNADEVKEAISAGKAKVTEYDAIAKKLKGDDTKEKEFEKDFRKQMTSVRESLAKLAK